MLSGGLTRCADARTACLHALPAAALQNSCARCVWVQYAEDLKVWEEAQQAAVCATATAATVSAALMTVTTPQGKPVDAAAPAPLQLAARVGCSGLLCHLSPHSCMASVSKGGLSRGQRMAGPQNGQGQGASRLCAWLAPRRPAWMLLQRWRSSCCCSSSKKLTLRLVDYGSVWLEA